MPFNRLPSRILYGELLNGQRLPGGTKLRYRDHIRRILSKFNIRVPVSAYYSALVPSWQTNLNCL